MHAPRRVRDAADVLRVPRRSSPARRTRSRHVTSRARYTPALMQDPRSARACFLRLIDAKVQASRPAVPAMRRTGGPAPAGGAHRRTRSLARVQGRPRVPLRQPRLPQLRRPPRRASDVASAFRTGAGSPYRRRTAMSQPPDQSPLVSEVDQRRAEAGRHRGRRARAMPGVCEDRRHAQGGGRAHRQRLRLPLSERLSNPRRCCSGSSTGTPSRWDVIAPHRLRTRDQPEREPGPLSATSRRGAGCFPSCRPRSRRSPRGSPASCS